MWEVLLAEINPFHAIGLFPYILKTPASTKP